MEYFCEYISKNLPQYSWEYRHVSLINGKNGHVNNHKRICIIVWWLCIVILLKVHGRLRVMKGRTRLTLLRNVVYTFLSSNVKQGVGFNPKHEKTKNYYSGSGIIPISINQNLNIQILVQTVTLSWRKGCPKLLWVESTAACHLQSTTLNN